MASRGSLVMPVAANQVPKVETILKRSLRGSRIFLRNGLESRRVDSKYIHSISEIFQRILQLAQFSHRLFRGYDNSSSAKSTCQPSVSSQRSEAIRGPR